MRILTLTSEGIGNAVATIFKNKDTIHFNIKHGSSGRDLHVWSCGMDKKYFNPAKHQSSTFELTDDNYVLLPVRKNGEQLKDKNNNNIYSVSIDNVKNHKKDIILIWEIPNNKYTSVVFTINGDVSLLGEGVIGKTRNGVDYTSPAPVLEIFGVCKLTWSGIDEHNNTVGGVIEYDKENGFRFDTKKD